MKFNKWYLMLGMVIVLLMLACAATQAQDTTPPAAPVQLTPQQLQNVDSSIQALLPYLSPKAQGVIIAIASLLVYAKTAGRIFSARAAGASWLGAVASVFFGSATINPPGNIPKGATGLTKNVGLWLVVLILPVLVLTGCKTQQIAENASGNGFKGSITVPVPLPGASGLYFLNAGLIVGGWKSTTVVQPTSTNGPIYAPSLAISQKTRGSQSLNGGTGASGTAGIVAGEYDESDLITGGASAETASIYAAGTNSTTLASPSAVR